MSTPLRECGYKRRKYIVERDDADRPLWEYSSITPVVWTDHSNTFTVDVGLCHWSGSSGYCGYPYLIFDMPASASGATITIEFENGRNNNTLYLRRVTAAIDPAGREIPETTTEHQVEFIANDNTVELDVSELIADIRNSGHNYGLAIIPKKSTLVTNCHFSVPDDISFSWEGGQSVLNARILIDGAWKSAAGSKILVGGEWHDISSSKILIDGAWK